MRDAKGVRNMYSILVVVNKHNTARVASCWFIIYYNLFALNLEVVGSFFQNIDTLNLCVETKMKNTK